MQRLKYFLIPAALVGAIALGISTGSPAGWLAAWAMFFVVDALCASRTGACYDNTLGTLATATIVQEALSLIFSVRPVLNSFSLGFTNRNGSPIAEYNQAVITRVLGAPTVQNFGGTISDRADTDVSVTLNNFKEVGYVYGPTEYSATNRDLIREAAMPLAIAVANHMVDAVGALWTATNFPTRTHAVPVATGATQAYTVKGAGWDYTHLTDVRGTLNKSGVPEGGRFYIGNTDVYTSLLTDARIVAALNNPSNEDAIRTGKLPNVAGFGIAEYPQLDDNDEYLVGVAGSKDSTVYAQRVPTDPRAVLPGIAVPGNLGVVTEPRTGLSVMVLEYLTMADLKITTKLIWMYGVAKGSTNNLQRIVSQAP